MRIGNKNELNQKNDDFFDFLDNSRNISISLCYSPFDLCQDKTTISSQSNGFKLTKVNNKVLFTFNDISSLNSFSLIIQAKGIKINSDDDFKTVSFIDENNIVIYKLPVSFFIDSNNKLFLDCRYNITKRDDGNYLFSFSIDEEAFKKDILFPITIDPEVTIPSSNVSMTGIIYNTNTNVADDFSSCMVGYSNQYMLGTS